MGNQTSASGTSSSWYTGRVVIKRLGTWLEKLRIRTGLSRRVTKEQQGYQGRCWKVEAMTQRNLAFGSLL